MSDGVKPDEDGSPNDGPVKRAGRARICKQCRFTTTDVKEFSNHRLHAHAQENSDDKTIPRKNNLRRKTSAASSISEEQHRLKDQNSESKNKTGADFLETKDHQTINESVTKTEDVDRTNSVDIKGEKEIENKMANEQISSELLNSLALAPRKLVTTIENGQSLELENGAREFKRRPSTENLVLEKMNGLKENIVLVNKDDEQDDEHRLVIAEDYEIGDALDTSGSEPASLCRSGNIQNRTYICGECEFSSCNAKEYLHHQKAIHHADMLIYECDICDYATRYKQKLPRHRKLHFNGKDGESDLDSSLTAGELRELKDNMSMRDNSSTNEHINGEEDMEEDGYVDDDEEEDMVTLSAAPEGIPIAAGAPVEKKKRIRQEVDPLKYYEVVDDVGVKYACSKCGNVYKWRKSLNKHWKEKHFGEVPDLTKPPGTLQNYTLFSRFKAKYGGQPPPPAAPNVVYGPAQATPANQVKNRSTPTTILAAPTEKSSPSPSPSVSSLSNVVMPRQIGPFIAGTNASSGIFNSPVVTLANQLNQRTRTPENHHEIRQMMDNLKQMPNKEQRRILESATDTFQQNQQSEPLDFSKKPEIKLESSWIQKKTEISVKMEPIWTDTNSESDSLQDMPFAMMVSQANNQIAAAMKQSQDLQAELDGSGIRCTKCNFVAKSLVDYSSHMSLHLNKRAFKCAECQAHFNGVDDLNKHFLDNHSEKIQEHKEAIQKIPHGLQQTYHLLKMPLDSISGLSSQELLSSEPKQLKCSMCNFIAKWPAELQKHAVSHSEERPFVCMVCASTYKWKWDLVKHFEKSHSSLPNPYKRREGGGVIASTTNSPVTTPLDALTKSAALMEASMIMASTTNYMIPEDMPPVKKRRLSDSEIQNSEEFYRELLERQVRQRREMSQQSETPPNLKIPIQNRAAFSEPLLKASELKKEKHVAEEQIPIPVSVIPISKENTESQTPKKNVHEALKLRLHFGKPFEEEVTPPKPTDLNGKNSGGKTDVTLLPYKCSVCEYRARWPSEISQHMKNHSNEKPFHCPRCSYKSKWKWDVVKHLRRCGGGTVHDVIDTTKLKKMAPPNVTVLPQGGQQSIQQAHQLQKTSPSQPVFPGNYRSSSLSPAMVSPAMYAGSSASSSSSITPTPNFTMAIGGQDHPDGLDLLPNSAAELQAHLNGGKQPVFRSLVNQGIHHCLECPFIGSNAAELRRHAVLHSENKPFSCIMCGYSTRWKCDLKKHMRTYGHFNNDSYDSGDDLDNSNDQLMDMGDEESDEENKSTLYMCPQCPYNSYKKSAFDLHLRIHGSMMEEPSMAAPSKNASAKYKCSKCLYLGNDLSSFLQHKRSHNLDESQNGSRNSTPVPGEASTRTVHLKNRRKPVKQFRCDRCPFVCFTKNSVDVHAAMHIPRGSDTYLCMFCDYNVFSKTLLLQHMRLHPEYNPAECSEADGNVTATELMEMEELEDREINGDDTKSMSETEENNNVDGYESGFENTDGVLDFSKVVGGRSSTPVMPVESKSVTTTNNNNTILNNNNNKIVDLPCEWCAASFPNVVALYQHSQTLHPNQLKAQEAGDIAARQAPSKGSQLEQIVRERQREYQVYHQFMARQQPQIKQQIQTQMQAQAAQSLIKKFVPLAPKPNTSLANQSLQSTPLPIASNTQDALGITQNQGQLSPHQIAALRARKSASIQRKSRSFQCTKCSFTAPNAVTYLRHIEHHGSNCKHTCRYCDYSIDRLNLLYQHMKGTHPNKWQGTLEEKITISVHSEDSNNNIIDAFGAEDDNDELDASFNSNPMESVEGDMEGRSLLECGALSEYTTQGIKPVVMLGEDVSFKGVTIKVCSLDGKKHYKCTKCLYISNHAANTANHSLQHGQNNKYKCHQCDYSVDNFKHIQNHLENIHPKEPNFILLNSPRTSVLIDDFPPEINNNGEPTNTGMKTQETNAVRMFTCSKCPYKTAQGDKLTIHLGRHSYNGKYECQLCDYSVDHYNFLRSHAKLHNMKFMPSATSAGTEDAVAGEDSYEDIEFANKTRTGITISSRQQPTIEDKIRFRCACCPFFTSSKMKILNHRLNHINKRPYACQLCTFSTTLTNELEEHVHYHQNKVPSTDQFIDITLDPFSEMYRVFEKFPDDKEGMDTDENKIGDVDKGRDNDDNAFEEYDKMEDDGADVEDDEEAAMMEEELKDTIGEVGFEKPVERNLNADCAFDSEIQFRNYKCRDCPYSSNSHAEFKKHCRLHGTNNKFKCDYCTYSLDRVNLISQHRRLHFQEKDFELAPSMSKLLNKSHEDHDVMVVKVGNEVAYPPSEGSAKTIDESMDLFISQRVALSADDKTRYTCNKCPYKCQALKSFRCHLQMHGLNRKYKCDYCDWSTDRLNLICQHRRVHTHEKDYNPTPGDIVFLNREYVLDGQNNVEGVVGVAMMDYPDSPFSSVSEIIKPISSPKKNAHGEKIFYCKICPFQSDSINTYSYHKKLHCIQARYTCSQCSYSINNITSLKEHIKLHKKEREIIKASLTEGGLKHKCPKCPYSSANKNLLVAHTSMHASGREYGCTQCDYSSDRQALLQVHMKVHNESYSDGDSLEEMELLMNHGSDVIGPQLFLTSTNTIDLDSESSDSNDSDHKCEKCPFSTPSKDELGDHIKQHETPGKNRCMYCTFNCSKDDELLHHVQVHFPGTTVDKDLLKSLRRQSNTHKRNIARTFGDSDGELPENQSFDGTGEPDSTVNDTSKEESSEGGQISPDKLESVKESEKTKVYVCQFCEREFDCKTIMLQHEKQHLF